MSRLIDADYITEDRVNNDPVVIAAKCAPTIDAIPVEWMRDKMRGYASALKSTETAALVRVMQMWQKEQEKQGIEPKEG